MPNNSVLSKIRSLTLSMKYLYQANPTDDSEIFCFVLLCFAWEWFKSKQLFIFLYFFLTSLLWVHRLLTLAKHLSHASFQASHLSFIPSGWNILVQKTTFSFSSFASLRFVWNDNNLVRFSLHSLLSITYPPILLSLCCLITHIECLCVCEYTHIYTNLLDIFFRYMLLLIWYYLMHVYRHL